MNTATNRTSLSLAIASSPVPRSGDRSRSSRRIRWALALCCLLSIPAGETAGGAEPATASTVFETDLRAANPGQELPLDFAYRAAGNLRLRFHSQESFKAAHFTPFPLRPLEEIPDDSPLPRGPTLYLYGPVYAPEGRLVPMKELAVDSAEGLFNALLLAYFELEILASDSPLRRTIYASSRERLPDLALEHQVPAFVQALSDFGSHVLTVANQLNVLEARSRAEGKDLCHLLERPATLFGLWEGMFQQGRYLARFYRPAAEGELRGGWTETSVAISPEDKKILTREVLRKDWVGTREKDLKHRFCPPPPS